MKLVRFGKIGREKPGIIDEEGQIRDLSTNFISKFYSNYLVEKDKKCGSRKKTWKFKNLFKKKYSAEVGLGNYLSKNLNGRYMRIYLLQIY